MVARESTKGVPPPVRRRVGAVVADFPDHDHRALVGDVVDYWRDGRGARTVRKDLAKVYRDKCSRSTPPPESPVGDSRVTSRGEPQQWKAFLVSGGAS
jgi:hypothetical protein